MFHLQRGRGQAQGPLNTPLLVCVYCKAGWLERSWEIIVFLGFSIKVSGHRGKRRDPPREAAEYILSAIL